MKDKKTWYSIKDFAIITLGAVLAAAAIYFFMLPSHVAVGSASALAMVISNFVPVSVSLITLLLNVFFANLGFYPNRSGIWCENSVYSDYGSGHDGGV